MRFLCDIKKIELNNMTISSNKTCIIEEMDLTKLSKTELLAKCEELGITKCKTKNKCELINLINDKKQSNKKKVELVIVDINNEAIYDNDNKDNMTLVKNISPKNISYSELSINLTKKINSNDKKNNGIYFTPPETIIKNITILEPYMEHIKTVLEPSCGSCEYILMLDQKYNLNITGIEIHKVIFDSIKSIEKCNITLHNENYLTYTTDNKFDLIIGNPPYFVMNKDEVDNSYYDYFDGRPNIFILFIIKSLQLLNTNGILSFVLPKNFLNCLYYDKTRKYITEHFKIINIINCNDKYIETSQETIIIVLQNTGDTYHNNIFCLNSIKFTIFGLPESINKLYSLYNGATTLSQLGFRVNVGNIVWNQCKYELTNDTTKTLLIYSSDIKNNKLNIQNYSNKDKKNYINRKGETGPLLVINRGYGVGKYNFTYCLFDMDFEYLIENHLICVRYTKTISNDELKVLYNKIIESFENNMTKEFIKLYFGNNAINTTELCEILPIYDI
jgi:type I restriction-modification system DNA methylase subunit